VLLCNVEQDLFGVEDGGFASNDNVGFSSEENGDNRGASLVLKRGKRGASLQCRKGLVWC
jgi:hypothetical protein